MNLKKKIKIANILKLQSNSKMFDIFSKNSLDFTHYYQYGDKVVSAGYDWIPQFFTEFREYTNIINEIYVGIKL